MKRLGQNLPWIMIADILQQLKEIYSFPQLVGSLHVCHQKGLAHTEKKRSSAVYTTLYTLQCTHSAYSHVVRHMLIWADEETFGVQFKTTWTENSVPGYGGGGFFLRGGAAGGWLADDWGAHFFPPSGGCWSPRGQARGGHWHFIFSQCWTTVCFFAALSSVLFIVPKWHKLNLNTTR